MNISMSCDFPRRGIALAVAFLIVTSLSGCGFEEYEKRLEATRTYYAYQDKLDQNLAAPWKMPPIDVLRVPLQFKELPAPQPVEGPDGKLELPEVDPRQPDYASLRIKGLIGAWRADVDVAAGDKREPKPVYLYAATNHEVLLSDAEAAGNFTKNLVAELEAALQTTAKTEPAAVFPKGHLFTPKQTIDDYLLNSEVPIHGSRYVVEIFAIRQTDNQVAMIVVRPEGMDPQAKVSDRIQLMLETMRVSAAPPQPRQPGQSAAPAGPAPTQPGF